MLIVFKKDKLYSPKISAKVKKKNSPTMQDKTKLNKSGRKLFKIAKIHLHINTAGIEEITSSENNNLVIDDQQFKELFDNLTSKYLNISNLIKISDTKFNQ